MKSCLIVEDELTCRKIAAAMMRKMGFEVRESMSVPQAIEEFTQKVPDMILLDWYLPGLDGLALLKYMQHIKPEIRPLIVMCTGVDDEVNTLRAMKKGADAYIVKPLKYDELEACLTDLGLISKSDDSSTASDSQ